MTATNFDAHKMKVKLRTGGSSAVIKSEKCSKTDQGLEWDLTETDKTDDGQVQTSRIRLPVRFRYRSPIFFEFSVPGKRHNDTYASLWLQDLVDSEEKDFNIPIWKCDNGLRLSQNYITEENFRDLPTLDVEEIGRLHFRGRFKPGMDRDHLKFVSDNNSRETIETWEACFAEGVRGENVVGQVPPSTQKLHDASLTQGRDILAQADEKDKEKWLAKDGTDWSGAFGKNPTEMIGNGDADDGNDDTDESDDDTSTESGDIDLGINDAKTNDSSSSYTPSSPRGPRESMDSQASVASTQTKSSKNPVKKYKEYKERSRDLHRQHRGLMQW